MKKIGILGGTFNPVHKGHLNLAQAAYRELALDEVWLMPTGCSYMKDENSIAPGEVRMDMLQLACEDFPYLQVSDMELVREGNTYSYETLETLREQYPHWEFYFILGADCLFSIPKWRYPQRIFDASIIVAAVREGASREDLENQAIFLNKQYGARVHLLTMKEIPASSTEVRSLIEAGEVVSELVPEKVAAYIKEKGLYRA